MAKIHRCTEYGVWSTVQFLVLVLVFGPALTGRSFPQIKTPIRVTWYIQIAISMEGTTSKAQAASSMLEDLGESDINLVRYPRFFTSHLLNVGYPLASNNLLEPPSPTHISSTGKLKEGNVHLKQVPLPSSHNRCICRLTVTSLLLLFSSKF